MGQASNSRRHASLDEQKLRAAGRFKDPTHMPDEPPRVAGAFGAASRPNAAGPSTHPTGNKSRKRKTGR